MSPENTPGRAVIILQFDKSFAPSRKSIEKRLITPNSTESVVVWASSIYPEPENFELDQELKDLMALVRPDTRVEVIIVLRQFPGGEWHEAVSQFTESKNMGLHIIVLTHSKELLSEEDPGVAFMRQHGVDVQQLTFPNYHTFEESLKSIVQQARSLPTDFQEPGGGVSLPPGFQPFEHDHADLADQSVVSAGVEKISEPMNNDAKEPKSLTLPPVSGAMSQDASSVTPEPEKEIPQQEITGQQAPVLPDQQVEIKAGVISQPDPQKGAEKTEVESGNEQGNKPALNIEVGANEAIKPEPEPEPAVGKDGVATAWKNIDPPLEMEDRFDHVDKQFLPVGDDWVIVAASRRGKMHAHQGIFREDAFALGNSAGWHFVVVADGGGSRPLARVGSNLAANTAVDAMCALAHELANSSISADKACKLFLSEGLEKAYDALENEAQKRGRKIDDFGTTFLAMAHHPLKDQPIIGTLQVGDGLIAAKYSNQSWKILADPDVGEVASQTSFLTGKPWPQWIQRIKIHKPEFEPSMLAIMCDGVSDDLIPYQKNLPKLFERMEELLEQKPPEEELLQFLSYEKRGSFDDRTLVLVSQRAANKQSDMGAAEDVEKSQVTNASLEEIKLDENQSAASQESPNP